MYVNVEGVRCDFQRGVEWLRKVAANGKEDARRY